jgi:hypothetical protein
MTFASPGGRPHGAAMGAAPSGPNRKITGRGGATFHFHGSSTSLRQRCCATFPRLILSHKGVTVVAKNVRIRSRQERLHGQQAGHIGVQGPLGEQMEKWSKSVWLESGGENAHAARKPSSSKSDLFLSRPSSLRSFR